MKNNNEINDLQEFENGMEIREKITDFVDYLDNLDNIENIKYAIALLQERL